MSLVAGSSLGPYQILAPLGSGGMGEVYRARDTKLNRDVALKVLPDGLTADPERVARFHREAQLLAALNHPNIGSIYGLEDSDGIRALVLELVEGPTVADRIAHGPIPLDEALPIARQIAEALEAAHEKGVIHRDLKPANIKVRDDGSVKVLDFGLAKILETDSTASGPPAAYSPGSTQSPTITTPAMTQMGMILGTAAYMSPEQAKGRPADKRSDIWAFGCVLFEMLTGKRAFEAEDVSDTLAAVLRGEPDWTRIPPDVPVPIRVCVQRCLEKDRSKRIGDVSTVRFVINEAAVLTLPGGTTTPIDIPRSPIWRRASAVLIGVLLTGTVTAGAMWAVMRPPASQPAVARFPISLDEGHQFGSNGLRLVAISPDGSQIAYAASAADRVQTRPLATTQGLYLRSMADDGARPIPGTEVEGAVGGPVFSPDGQSIAFYVGSNNAGVLSRAKGLLKRIGLNGGTAVTLCEIDLPLGISWNRDGIMFGQLSKGIMRVSPNGGEPEQVVPVEHGEILQGPLMLPDGDSLLFTQAQDAGGAFGPFDDVWDKAQVVVQSLNSGKRKTLVEGGSDARFLSTGHLVYAVGGTLRAVPFDPKRLEVTGRPTPVVQGIGRSRFGPNARTGSAHFSISEGGSLVYLPGPVSLSSSPPQDLAFLDRDSRVELLKLPPAPYEFPHISPDGKQVAVGTNDGREANVWIYDLSRTSSRRQLTFGGKNRFPVWSPDGQHLAFQSDREGDFAIFWQKADGTAPAERLTKPVKGTSHVPESWSAKANRLAFDVIEESSFSLWTLSLPDRKAEPFGDVRSKSVQPAAAFSPDGRWIAYQSGEIPDPQVFVQTFTSTGTKYQIARGRHPRWSPDGSQLFYTLNNRILAVGVVTRPSFRFATPAIIATGFSNAPMAPASYDVAPDANRFMGTVDAAGLIPAATGATRRIEVVLNWQEELKQRVPFK
jgi:eukaryotic-like serine/threonine-protein kinase